ncbi:HsdM family class I SAM-dependent methyltransferase [Chryseobacterium herbae]|uniref:site-specific DNA-methyltransferase (adenine-specific) n=1 Tax=Chryseobacterium herbae TaxID=2976476 RepID=A0ABT2INW5_9FLAO|nr:SAM-dependent methyltransferase [Chryseobacterium sp. pc1-10]MCT2560512.1 SAM-dependent methyltransferase [Chryseobacterium sp. pc1-10]
MDTDTKGDMYEGLLEKNAQDTKSGAGQYFTPRDLIRAIVECIDPHPMKTIADPACGTEGFFLSAIEHLQNNSKLSRKEKLFLENETFYGWEIVPSTRRLCLMNLFLHNIGDLKSKPPIYCGDALKNEPIQKFDHVLANPPFGKKAVL